MNVSGTNVNVNAALIAQFNRTTIKGKKADGEEDGQEPVLSISSDTIEIGALVNISFDQGSKITVDQIIARLQEAFQKEGVEVDLKGALESGLDTSPEATADRIFNFATSFFDVFVQKHVGGENVEKENSTEAQSDTEIEGEEGQELKEAKGAEGQGPKKDVADQFVDLIRGAIKKGFEDARKILAGLPTMNDDIMKQINKTFDLVMEKLDKFLEDKKTEQLKAQEAPKEQPAIEKEKAA